jgi:hypothetical protein
MLFHTHRQAIRLVLIAWLVALPARAAAQTYSEPQPRRQFVSVSYDWMHTEPLHFAEHPLEDLLGREVASAQLQEYDYETRDGLTHVYVNEFRNKGNGFGVTVYPFGLSAGATLGVRGSVEQLPQIDITFEGPAPVSNYLLANAKSYDVGAGVVVADRSAGWGLGSQAFVIGGIGRIRSDIGDGSRYFAEGGGGLTSGPIGVQISVKFAWNRLDDPVEHRFLTVPITLRAMVSF